jgi:hypothetical protein
MRRRGQPDALAPLALIIIRDAQAVFVNAAATLALVPEPVLIAAWAQYSPRPSVEGCYLLELR